MMVNEPQPPNEPNKNSKILYNLNHPLAYTGNLKRLVKAGVNKDWLETQPTFTLHRAVKRKFPTRQYRTSFPHYQWQSDLVDMQQYKKQNRGYAHILTAIDIFSRYAYATPLKSKAYTNVIDGFKRLFKQIQPGGTPPLLLQTDQGTEFENRNIQQFFKTHNIKQFSVKSPFKASLVERFHRTLRGRMYRYFTKHGTKKWYDVLQLLVNGYNNTVHSSLYGQTPASITKENAMELWEKQQQKKPKNRRQSSRLKVNDLVRLAIAKRVFSHGYTPNWTEEIFQISEINTQVTPPMYTVKDLDTGEVIQGKFYTQELQKVANVFRIEKVLRTKKQGKKLMYYVKWMGYTTPSWISSEALVI